MLTATLVFALLVSVWGRLLRRADETSGSTR
jgi:hypothetical protein